MADEDSVALQEHDAGEQGEDQSANAQELGFDEDDALGDYPELQKELYDLWLKLMGEDRYARLVEVRDVKQAEMYWRNLQYIWWSDQDQRWNLPSQSSAVNWSDLDIDDMPRFEFSTNIYQAFGLTGIGALTQAVPPYEFIPDDADDPDDLETAEGETKLARMIWRWNPIQLLMQEEVWHQYTGGIVGLYTRYVEDGSRYGYEPIEQLQETDEQFEPDMLKCPNCPWTAPAAKAKLPIPCPDCATQIKDENVIPGQSAVMPQATGPDEKPKGKQLITAHGALNLKRPQWAQEQSQFHYLALEDEFHYAILRHAHPHVADKIKPGAGFGADDAYERNARLSSAEGTRLLTQTGPAQSILCTYARIWFRPSAFWILSKDSREKFFKACPEIETVGYRANFAGDVYCEGRAESMDKHWRIYHAMPGRGQHRPGTGSSMISVQDRFNTFSNISAETYEYGIPITYRDAESFDEEANEDQRSEPGSEVPIYLDPGADIRAKVMQTRADSVSPDMYKHMMDLMGPIGQFLTGYYPALQGNPDVQTETVGGIAIQRDQAMGRAGVPYVPMKVAHADITSLACEDFQDKQKTGIVKQTTKGATGEYETEAVDVAALEGSAKAHPAGEEGFPEMPMQSRATAMQLMDSPQGQALIQDPEVGPDNAELFCKLSGIDGVKIPGAIAKKKAMRCIGFLTKIQPGADQSADMSQIAAALVDSEVDDSQALAAAVKRWMNDDDGMRCFKRNGQGYQNVRAYMLAQKALIPPPQPATKAIGENFTTNFKDLPPAAQQKLLAQLGINLAPEDFLVKVMMDKAARTRPNSGVGGLAGRLTNAGNRTEVDQNG